MTFYADAVKEGGHEFTMNDDEQGAATNVKAMEMVFQRTGLGTFGISEKAAAALVLIDAWGKEPHFRARTHPGEGARRCRRHQRSIQRAVVKRVPNGGETERRGRARGRLSVAPADRPALAPLATGDMRRTEWTDKVSRRSWARRAWLDRKRSGGESGADPESHDVWEIVRFGAR